MLRSKGWKLAAIVLAAVFIAGVAGIAWPVLAETAGTAPDKIMPPGHHGGAGDGLDKALENGDITQAQYDAMTALRERTTELKDQLADLSPEERHTAMKEARAEVLQELLDEGTISQELYDELSSGKSMGIEPRGFQAHTDCQPAPERKEMSQAEYNAMKVLREKMAGLKDELADLTGEERQTAMKEAQEEILQELLDDGTITQEIYDNMTAGLDRQPNPGRHEVGEGFGGRQGGMRNCPAE